MSLKHANAMIGAVCHIKVAIATIVIPQGSSNRAAAPRPSLYPHVAEPAKVDTA